MKIIITRPSPDGEIFAGAVSRLGGNPIHSPVMAIRFRDIDIDFNGIGSLAFTSANGVRAYSRLSGARNFPVYAVGEATAAAAHAAGFADVRSADGSAESLAALIAESKPTTEVLHLAGSERAGDLICLLEQRGIGARRLVAYDAEKIELIAPAARAALSDPNENTAVVFFSPRSASLFLDQAAAESVEDRLQGAVAFCLSDEVATALGGSRWSKVAVAKARTAGAMLRLVEDAIAGRNGRMAAPR